MAQIALPKMLADAQAAEEAGKLGVAQAILSKATTDYPKDPKSLLRLVRLLARKGKQPKLALPLLPRLLKLAPASGLAHELAAETYCKLRSYEIALVHADKALALAPKSPDCLYVAATVYQQNARHDEAIKLIKRALALRPDHRPSKLLLASSLNATGQQKEAEAICRAIFAETPNNQHNLMLWNSAVKASVDDPIYQYIKNKLLPEFTATDEQSLRWVLRTLGKAENDIGNYTQSFKYYTQAKALEPKRHERGKNKQFVSALLAKTSRADFFGGTGHDSENPVLIVGMPRTGSTLLEQILSSHPQIGGIGESAQLRNLATSIGFKSGDGAGLAKLVQNLSPQKAKELAEIYLKNSSTIAPGKLRVVDKNLHNFELLGLYAKLFPKGRIILALRDPMDNCVSCYLQPLSGFHSYTQDLTSMGQYYAEFRRLVAHWQKVIPNPMMEVHYEDMVADTEGMARKIIDFIGVDWDPACLSFQENKSHVRTLSVSQVRQPIYKTAVKRWQRYEEFLDPLKAELAHLYPDGF
ncbi:anaphase-promoting complex subunit 3 [Loktanella sp. PT4BL]|uniref:sulfotransferase family protein n=1 Tax=Loktanella sp. PT4BL TaxID=2135611 RepID=UPI000D83ABCD|nr:tetratricopeptide repeat-containing sulfotransferase family protein [Loktanella sp. PT4BL]PXW69163.1 anaphase-promoting complex subunit 3 [Loktanella sp. PT4BL]